MWNFSWGNVNRQNRLVSRRWRYEGSRCRVTSSHIGWIYTLESPCSLDISLGFFFFFSWGLALIQWHPYTSSSRADECPYICICLCTLICPNSGPQVVGEYWRSYSRNDQCSYCICENQHYKQCFSLVHLYNSPVEFLTLIGQKFWIVFPLSAGLTLDLIARHSTGLC